ncbi:transmembrane protein 218 isoform X1 [Corythoichthys intestinalis]|uniref:transmembrane protein 218 isoform X1 n=1 Tax=Corythoichthys intestinalis TaxID=161448 RepID=UPI0025A53E22|nr:transmembrane protein 218 isoform X1 [Corythoichthys intestinalis]
MENPSPWIGQGIFILAGVLIASLLLGVVLHRATGSLMLGVVPVFFLALTVTLALVFFPQSPSTPSAFKEKEIVDPLFIARYVLLGLATLIFLFGLVMLLPFHFLEPVYAKALRTH